jgi:hypothetical protein
MSYNKKAHQYLLELGNRGLNCKNIEKYIKNNLFLENINKEKVSMFDLLTKPFINFSTLAFFNHDLKNDNYESTIVSNSIDVLCKAMQFKFENYSLSPEVLWKAYCYSRLQYLQFSSKESSV